LVLALVIFILSISLGQSYDAVKKFNGSIKLYKSNSCGCCGIYSSYFKSKGNPNLKIINIQDNSEMMKKNDIPPFLESCHTLIIGKYFIEGHVPLEAIEKLLKEKPNISGIGMPGMPSGSPGMAGSKTEDFVIYGVDNNGTSFEFMRI